MKKLPYLFLFLLSIVVAPIQAQPESININSATIEQLVQLKGIGTKYAERIIRYRETNGPFRSGSDMQNVRGIGPKIYEMNKAQIVVSDPVVE